MKFRFSSAFFFTLIAHSALADTQDDFDAAGVQLAIAAGCRASYGENELFEVAFANFEKIARKSSQDITDEELADAKQKLYETEAETGDNFFLRGFCEKLKEELLPAGTSGN